MSDIVLAAIQETARRAQADLADARKVIAKLERELETERIGLQHMEIGIVNGKPVAEFTMDGSASKRIIEALCIHFAEKGGENFVETSFEIHPAVTSPPGVQKVGDFYFTIQRKNGSTPGQQLTEARARIAQLESQIVVKDAAQFAIRGVLGDLEFIAQGGNTATSAEALCGTYERVAARALTAIREALKGSAK